MRLGFSDDLASPIINKKIEEFDPPMYNYLSSSLFRRKLFYDRNSFFG